MEVLGYPHGGNDVFHAKGVHNNKEVTAYIKAERQKGAAIENEVAIMRQLDIPVIPRILDADFGEHPFSVTTDMPGLRLSSIVGDNSGIRSLEYMEEYGEVLGRIHKSRITAKPVADRRFFHTPPDGILEKLDLAYLKRCFAQKPTDTSAVFCHGDFHYANLLWKERHISGILDFELAGYGDRDFDIAWALILRPGQRFLKTREEQNLFLAGYSKHGKYHAQNVSYYMAQIYVYFLNSCGDDAEYCNYIRAWLFENCK